MTNDELNAWVTHTAKSKTQWVSDPIWESKGMWLLHRGGEKGVYIEINREGAVTVGSYSGAYPHIGEALFRPEGTTKMGPDANEALIAVSERMGFEFFRNVFLGV